MADQKEEVSLTTPGPGKVEKGKITDKKLLEKTPTATSDLAKVAKRKFSEKQLLEKLKQHFNHSQFKSSRQRRAIERVLSRTDDVYISMPTGSGKSLCFQLPGMLQDNQITIVFSPLLALIKDQIDHLAKLRINAESINSKMTTKERDRVVADLRSVRPSTRFLYITPEQAVTESFRGILSTLIRFDRVAYFAVDEAHCVSDWGHDFRPDYLRLGELRVKYPKVPWIALTATASSHVVKDIMKRLCLKDPVAIFKTPCFRKNLFYDVVFKETIQDDFIHLKEYVFKCLGNSALDVKDNQKPCGIIYCRTRESVEQVAHGLSKHGVPTKAYHAGLKTADRVQVQEDWMDGVYPVICATISFGMGVDKSTVRFVIHWDVPQSVAGYYQESGRAGRDGKPSFCRIYYCRKAVKSIDFLLKADITKAKEHRKEQAMRSSKDFQQVCAYCETVQCRHRLFSNYFGDDPPECKKMCDVCSDRKAAEQSLETFNKLAMNFYTGGRISTQDGSDLYGGGREGMKQNGVDGDGNDSGEEYGASSSLAKAKQETSSLIQREFALRKVAAAKEAEMHPTAQLTKVKAAMSTAVKVTGLTNTIRESYLKMMADLLKTNYTTFQATDPTEHVLVYRDFEDIALEIEYDCFTRNKVLTLYRRSCAIEGNKLKKFTLDGKMHDLLKTHKPRKRNVVGGDSKDKQSKVDELDKKNGSKTEAGVKRKTGFKKDLLTQTTLGTFFEKKKPELLEDGEIVEESISPKNSDLEDIVSDELTLDSTRMSFEDIESEEDSAMTKETPVEESPFKAILPSIALKSETELGEKIAAELANADRSKHTSSDENDNELIRLEIEANRREIERLDKELQKKVRKGSSSSSRHKEKDSRGKHKRKRSKERMSKSKHRSRSPKRVRVEPEKRSNEGDPIDAQELSVKQEPRDVSPAETVINRERRSNSREHDFVEMNTVDENAPSAATLVKTEPKKEPKETTDIKMLNIKQELRRSVSPAATVIKDEPRCSVSPAPTIKRERSTSPASTIRRERRSNSREHDFDDESSVRVKQETARDLLKIKSERNRSISPAETIFHEENESHSSDHKYKREQYMNSRSIKEERSNELSKYSDRSRSSREKRSQSPSHREKRKRSDHSRSPSRHGRSRYRSPKRSPRSGSTKGYTKSKRSSRRRSSSHESKPSTSSRYKGRRYNSTHSRSSSNDQDRTSRSRYSNSERDRKYSSISSSSDSERKYKKNYSKRSKRSTSSSSSDHKSRIRRHSNMKVPHQRITEIICIDDSDSEPNTKVQHRSKGPMTPPVPEPKGPMTPPVPEPKGPMTPPVPEPKGPMTPPVPEPRGPMTPPVPEPSTSSQSSFPRSSRPKGPTTPPMPEPSTSRNPDQPPLMLNIEDPHAFDEIVVSAHDRILAEKKRLLDEINRVISVKMSQELLNKVDRDILIQEEHKKRQRDDELEQQLGTDNLDDWDNDPALSNVAVAQQIRQERLELESKLVTKPRRSLVDQLMLKEVGNLVKPEHSSDIQKMLAQQTDYKNMDLRGRIIELENMFQNRKMPVTLNHRIKVEKQRIADVVKASLQPYYEADRFQPAYLFNEVARYISRLFYSRRSEANQIKEHVDRIFVHNTFIRSLDDVINSKYL